MCHPGTLISVVMIKNTHCVEFKYEELVFWVLLEDSCRKLFNGRSSSLGSCSSIFLFAYKPQICTKLEATYLKNKEVLGRCLNGYQK